MVTKSSSVPSSVGDYAVVALSMPATKSYPIRTKHYLYVRPNAPQLPTPTSPRELFLVNIPVDTTQTHIRSLFTQHLGGFRVDKVHFYATASSPDTSSQPASKKRKRRSGAVTTTTDDWPITSERPLHPSGDSCIVTLIDEASAQAAMKAAHRASRTRPDISWDASSPLGSARYARMNELRYPDPSALQDSVDAFMATFNSAEAERARAAAKARQMPDEDGFVTVTRGGRNNPARAAEVQAKLEQQRERHKGREDFYRFQMREKRKDEARTLQRGFEEERRRVQEMRGKRKYRPE